MWRFILAAWLVTLAPWRLMALGVEVLCIHPGYTRTSLGNNKYWEAQNLELRLNGMGWRVEYMPGLNLNGQRAFGVTDPEDHLITIDSDLGWNARYATLAHEAGHTMQSPWVSRIGGEVFAESVATLLSHDGLREHARWLAMHRSDCVLFLLTEWPSIYRAAAVLEQ